MKQKRIGHYFTCVFADGTIIQTAVRNGTGRTAAIAAAASLWAYRKAMEFFKEQDPKFELKPPSFDGPSERKEFNEKLAKVRDKAIAMGPAPEVKLFQWEKKNKRAE